LHLPLFLPLFVFRRHPERSEGPLYLLLLFLFLPLPSPLLTTHNSQLLYGTIPTTPTYHPSGNMAK
jgi:hypothetical protein